MEITSPAFEQDEMIPDKYTCNGENVNPPLNFTRIPPAAKSLALIVEDPDAPNGIFTHWLVWKIDPNNSGIEEASTPPNVQEGRNDFGNKEYGGPCPPPGDPSHRYLFKLYALDTVDFPMPVGGKRQDMLQAINDHIIEEATLVGRYQRD
jgi:hypothetical protein